MPMNKAALFTKPALQAIIASKDDMNDKSK